MAYRCVLVAVDLLDECRQVVQRARELLAPEGRLLLVHVIGPIPLAWTGEIMMEQPVLREEQLALERQHVERFATSVGVAAADCRYGYGDTRHEVHRLAQEEGADIIVVGSHGRHGLELLLGSTANDVLHGAPCDVLAVRLPNDDD